MRLDIQSAPGCEKFQLKGVLTTDSLPVTPRHIAMTEEIPEEIQEWPHLQDIVLPKTRGDQVTILIGGDRPDIIDNYPDRREWRKGRTMHSKDHHAGRILNKTTTLKNGHYQIGLLFKHKPLQLPDNHHTAEMQLKSLKSRMERNPDFRRKSTSVMENTKPKVQREKLQTRS